YQRERPCVVVLDDYSVHHSNAVQAALPALAAAAVTLFYLPPYSPGLNAIEPHWRHPRYEQLQVRSYPTVEALQAAVDEALTKQPAVLHDPTRPLFEYSRLLSGLMAHWLLTRWPLPEPVTVRA